MQRELSTRRGEGIDAKDGGSASRGVFSPQDSPCNIPRSPRAPRSPCASSPVLVPSTRSHSDSEAMLEEQSSAMRLKSPTENLFLDALSLDPLGGLEVPPPSRLETEKRFPCMKEVMHQVWSALLHVFLCAAYESWHSYVKKKPITKSGEIHFSAMYIGNQSPKSENQSLQILSFPSLILILILWLWFTDFGFWFVT